MKDAPGRYRSIRGVLDNHDLDGRIARRDIRAPSRRLIDLLRRPHAAAIVIVSMILIQYVFPIWTHFTWAIALIIFMIVRGTDANLVLPLRLPMSANRPDLNDPKPGRKESHKARGVFHIGNEMDTGFEIWEAAKDIVMHWLVFGATGSGKAQPLTALVLTLHGYIRMGDVRIGTVVVTPSGRTSTVIAIYPQGKDAVYRITLEDGRSTRATADHLWLTHRDASDRGVVLTTREIQNRLIVCTPFYLPVRLDDGSITRMQVISIEPDGHESCQCILLDDPDHLYITDQGIVTHNTETLLSCCASNVISMGSGMIYSDAKASPDLAWKMHYLARRMGRDDDFLVINYITGNRVRRGRDRERMSNTSNPFAFGTADSLVQLLSSLIPTPQGDNAVFGQRAIALITAVLYPLVDLRDCGAINLGITVIRRHMNLQALMSLATDSRVENKSKAIAMAYLADLPGFDITKEPTKQREEVYRQFGFAVSYFTRALSSLSDTYGHIYWTDMGEVDLTDVIMNRRILVIMLPAIEKSVEELRNLGKISLSGARQALAIGLGHRLEGTKTEVLDNIPTVGRVPFIVVADEYAYQSTEGFAVTAAQARGLNVGIVFAGQDFAGFKKANEDEAEQIVSNTVTKFMMALTEASATWQLFESIGGEANVAQTQGFERNFDSPFVDYRDMGTAQISRIKRVDIRDAQEQIEGEAHIFFRGRLIRANMFHAGVTPPKMLKITRYLKVADPDITDLDRYSSQFKALDSLIMSRLEAGEMAEVYLRSMIQGTAWEHISTVLDAAGQHFGGIEQGIVGVLALADPDAAYDVTVAAAGGAGGMIARPAPSPSTDDDYHQAAQAQLDAELDSAGLRTADVAELDRTVPPSAYASAMEALDEGESASPASEEVRAPRRSALDILAEGGSDIDVDDELQEQALAEAEAASAPPAASDFDAEPQDAFQPADRSNIFPDALGIDEEALESALLRINSHMGVVNPHAAVQQAVEAMETAISYPKPPPVACDDQNLIRAVTDLERQLDGDEYSPG